MKGGILCFLCVLAQCRAAAIDKECKIIEMLSEKLHYENRTKYMQDYFPIDYRLYVKYEDVLRCENVTTLLQNNKGIAREELRYLWGIVNESILLSIKQVLRENHPTWKYIEELQTIFLKLLEGDHQEEVENTVVKEILERRGEPLDKAKAKAVTPKALLDNCFRVLYALYGDDCRLYNASMSLPMRAARNCLTRVGQIRIP
ncbi:interleukin-34 [Hyperolius riggenbachi]|uniref:interleukin-34 n=1 Tax=Hyperolius riggenbachi TaxID=752182 RepID=UPI0035A3CA22